MSGLDAGLFALFRDEVKAHADTLAAGLVELEADPTDAVRIEPLMRAAHSIKGAARIASIESAVGLAHVMEDALVAAQSGRVRLGPADIDQLLKGADVLAGLAAVPDPAEFGGWEAANAATVARLEPVFRAMADGRPTFVVSPDVAVEEVSLQQTSAAGADDLPPPPAPLAVVVPPDPIPVGDETGLLDLFREEVRSHLLAVTGGQANPVEAWQQLRGAARLMKVPAAEAAAAVVGYLSAVGGDPPAAGAGWVRHAAETLAGVIGTDPDTFPAWVEASAPSFGRVAEVLSRAAVGRPGAVGPPLMVSASGGREPSGTDHATGGLTPPARQHAEPEPQPPPVVADAVVRVTAQSLNRLMGLAGESLVQAKWLTHFSGMLARLKKRHEALAAAVEDLVSAGDAGRPEVAEAKRAAARCRDELADDAAQFDDHAARAEDLNGRLYREVIASRMRPFADGTHGLARLVRDMARTLGKQARLVVVGEATAVDRDVLEKLEAPLSHLIRNAVDHGIDPPAERTVAGKPECGTVRVEARHRAGMLTLTVADDGRGVDLGRLRQKVADRGLSTPDLVRRMTEAELLEFLFLPGFSTAAAVTEFSGRGVGLDVVQDAVRRAGGSVRVTTAAGRGTTFHLQLPITLSVIRAVVADIGGEPYAFPHTRIDRLLRVSRADVRSVEHRQFVAVDGQNVGLVVAAQVLGVPADPPAGDDLPVVLLADAAGAYGLVVDAIRGEQDLVVRPLDPRLGKVPNVSAAAVLDDGRPVLIADVDDLVRGMDPFIQAGALRRCEAAAGPARPKRVLVVDDSITVREVERQVLRTLGYEVEVAVDGADGWNRVRGGGFDLLITDVDMPRMTGLELVRMVRAEPALKDLPAVIVSYKERDEDRLRGLEAGADAYLTKSSFHDNSFADTVRDLIGPAA